MGGDDLFGDDLFFLPGGGAGDGGGDGNIESTFGSLFYEEVTML